MLQFTMIAGPNGAGKSTFSSAMSRKDAIIFDPDKEKALIEKQFPDISDDALESAFTRQYHNFELKAIAGYWDFTVETNLRNDFLAERAVFFCEANYQVRLVFILLLDIASSMDRVNLRVKKKGHFVYAQSIRYNFERSQENLFRVAGQFAEVMLVCAASGYEFKTQPGTIGQYKKRNGSP
jgi:predicted ABC-type ATPase